MEDQLPSVLSLWAVLKEQKEPLWGSFCLGIKWCGVLVKRMYNQHMFRRISSSEDNLKTKNIRLLTGVSSAKSEWGFTLIELLVVIAIIGILSSVVLASLNQSRAKAANASIKANLSSIRIQTEIFFDINSSYIVSGGWSGTACPTTVNTTNALNQAKVVDALNVIKQASGGSTTSFIQCVMSSNGLNWVVSAMLKQVEGVNTAWCVDSTGISRGRAGLVSSATGNLCNT